MHIPDGYVSPSTAAAALAAVAPFWVVAGRKVRAQMHASLAPRLGLFAAFSFVLMMFNIPLAGGTSGHAVGGALMALVLGPWPAVLGVSVALAIQALMFRDGGIWSFGANALVLAVILPFTAWGAYHALRRVGVAGAWAAGIAGWLGLMAAALAVAVMLGVQPMLFTSADGTPLYNPLGLKAALIGMMPWHALIAAPVEGIVTGMVWSFLLRARPEAMVTGAARPEAIPLRAGWIGLGALALMTPLGLLATGDAWGEWSAETLKDIAGFVPAGLARFEAERLPAWFPDYTVPGFSEPVGYVVAAVVGCAAAAGVGWAVTRLARVRREAEEAP